MAAALKLVAAPGDSVADQALTTTGTDAWATASADKRRVAELRAMLVEPLAARIADGRPQSTVLKTFAARLAADDLTATERLCVEQLGRGLSMPNVTRWLREFRAGGRAQTRAGKCGPWRCSIARASRPMRPWPASCAPKGSRA